MENRQMLVQMLPGQVSNVLGRLNLSYEKLQEILQLSIAMKAARRGSLRTRLHPEALCLPVAVPDREGQG